LYVKGGFTNVHLSILPAAYLIYLELCLMVAIALMFSSFSTPLLSALFSFAIYIIGHFSKDLQLAAQLSHSAVTRFVLQVCYYLVPNLSNFGFITQASYGQLPS